MSKIGEFRRVKDQYLGGDQDSPLTPEQRKRFNGLQYFPENPELRFVLSVEEFGEDAKDVIQMATSSGDWAAHVLWGQLHFEVDGTPVTLTVYSDADGNEFFLPFMDATTGGESYPGGRYVDLPATKDGRLVLDFNYAYNPHCAYNPHWSCPIPPAENRLPVAIKAGEKAFTDVAVR